MWAVHAEWQGHGLAVPDIHVTHDGMREFELRDLDGTWLWFGEFTSDPPTFTEGDDCADTQRGFGHPCKSAHFLAA